MNLNEFRDKYHYHQSTTVMQQYLDIKFEHIDCLILFHMGDFYELFFEDAILASSILGIALTKRGKSGENDIAMCGVPHHALENYLNKLLESEYKVAICEQVETPNEAKKRGGSKAIVNRVVTRIITAGTLIEETLLSGSLPNYLASLVISNDKVAISYVDLSTSFIAVTEVAITELINELSKINAKEILLSEIYRGKDISRLINEKLSARITYQVDSFFNTNKSLNIILNFYNIAYIESIGELSSTQISAIGSVIEYLLLTQKQNLKTLFFPKIINSCEYMNIDSATRRNLELTASSFGQKNHSSVLKAIDQTMTKSGARLLYSYLSAPLLNIEQINARLSLVNFFYNNQQLNQSIRRILKTINDTERCLARVLMNRSLPRDLLSIKHAISQSLNVKELFISQYGVNNIPLDVETLYHSLVPDNVSHDLIEQSIREDSPNSLNDGGYIKHDYHPKLTELYELINDNKTYIDALKTKYQAEIGLESLKISHNNIIGLFVEVSARNSGKITDSKFIHRQTTLNAVRYTTTELQKLESDIVNAKTLAIALEQEIYSNICHQLIDKRTILYKLFSSLSKLDVFCNFAYIACEYNYVKPTISDDMNFVIKEGRHLVVEKSYNSSNYDKSFIANDCMLSNNSRIALLTAPNMAGKSTYLRQNAIIPILAQIGSFVPAKEASIGVVDKVFSRIGSGDDLSRGQSTFMVEMLETSAILAQSTERSLIILDEVGRGTATYDGMSIAWSVLEYIHDHLKTRCLFATHYHELTNLQQTLKALENYTISIEEISGEVLFLHKIVKGQADKSYGIHVAQIAGLPKSVITRANEILDKFENKLGKL